MAKRAARVWIVEMWNDWHNRWDPTVGVALARDDARICCQEWRRQMPDDRFRIHRYGAL